MNKLPSTAAARTIGAVQAFVPPAPLPVEGQMRLETLLGLVGLWANRAPAKTSNVHSL